jgi:hypothetical protein
MEPSTVNYREALEFTTRQNRQGMVPEHKSNHISSGEDL